VAEPRLTERIGRIKASPTTAAADMARRLKQQGRPIISLTTGEPDFDPPADIIEAAHQAMLGGETRYTAVGGTQSLNAAVRAKFLRDSELVFSEDEVIISSGAKQVIFNALMALVEDGDEVIIPTPAWVSYLDMVLLTGGTPVTVPCQPETGFKLSLRDLSDALNENTRVLMLNAPSNPTGALYSEAELMAMADVLRAFPRVTIISDDIYEHLVYTQTAFATMAQVAPDLRERILTVNGVSKAYAMTGWRIGFAGGPAPLIGAMKKVQSQSSGGPSAISQAAAAYALSKDLGSVGAMRHAFARRRERIGKAINAIPGLSAHAPDGAFYFFVSLEGLIGRMTPDGVQLKCEADVVSYFLEAANVATVGGAAFGLSPYCRMTFAAADDVLDEAVSRLEAAVARLV